MKQKTAKLIGFGRGGHTIDVDEGPDCKCHISGYASPEDFCQPYHWWAHPPEQMTRHWDGLDIPRDGVPVVDKTQAVETPEGYSWVFKGPLVDVRLPDGETEDCPEPSPLFASAMAGNEWGNMLVLQKAHKATKTEPGPLDSVSVSEYVKGWRDHGARIGRFFVENGIGRIEWEA